MTAHSHTHYLLLKQLGITSLAAKPEFFTSILTETHSLQTSSIDNTDVSPYIELEDAIPAVDNSELTTSITTTDNIAVEVVAAQRVPEPATVHCYQPIPASRFADDVNTILSQTSLRNWQIDINASQCQITEQTLVTPPLPLLQQASLKRQLWQLLAGYLDD